MTVDYLYHEIYREIGFHLTQKGYWFFDEVPPSITRLSWSDYLSPEEQCMHDAETLRRAIDRFYSSQCRFSSPLQQKGKS